MTYAIVTALVLCGLFALGVYWLSSVFIDEKNTLRLYYEEVIRGMQLLLNHRDDCLKRKQVQIDNQTDDIQTWIQVVQRANENIIEAIKERDRNNEYIKSLEGTVAELIESDRYLKTFIDFMYPSYTYCVKGKRVEKIFSKAELQHIEALSCSRTRRCIFHNVSPITLRGDAAAFGTKLDPVKADEACAARIKTADELGYTFVTQDYVCKDSDSRLIACIVFQEKGQPQDEAWAFTIEYFFRWPAGDQKCFLVKKNVIEKTEWVPAVPTPS